MLTKENISELKDKGNGDLGHLVHKLKDSGSLVFILENLGHLPKNFDGSFLLDLLENSHAQVRLLAVKNIGKLHDETFTEKLAVLLES
jgi:hypothetical protein